MRIRTRITAEARARGLTGAEVARRLGWYRSNLSAMDAGHRSVSLRMVAKAAEVLACDPGDLLEVVRKPEPLPYRTARLNQRLREREEGAPDGAEKGWVHAAQLAWQRHNLARSKAR